MRSLRVEPSRRAIFLLLSGLAVLVLSGCGLVSPERTPTPFPDAAYTAAAQTIIAQLTQVAPTATTGPILLPTPTGVPGEEATATATEPPTAEPTLAPEPTETPEEDGEPTQEAEFTLVFEDDFSEETGWFVDQGDDFGFEYAGEVYRIYVELLNATVWTIREREFDDVRLEVDARRTSGPQDAYFGLVCRHQDEEDSYYGLVIGIDGFYGIGKSEEGEFEFIDTGMAEDVIESGEETNRIRADCIGNSLVVYANGEELLEVQDDDFESGFIGLVVGTRLSGGVTVEFDNFEIYEP